MAPHAWWSLTATIVCSFGAGWGLALALATARPTGRRSRRQLACVAGNLALVALNAWFLLGAPGLP